MGLFGSKPAVETPAPPPPAELTLEQSFKALAANKTAGDNSELSHQLMLVILNHAVRQGASDIHFDCVGDSILVRFRIDGGLVDQLAYPRNDFAITPRLRVLAGFAPKAATSYTPEDGRVMLALGTSSVQCRASAFPTTHGEKLVLRILDSGQTGLSLERLGFNPDVLAKLQSAIRSPSGIFFVAGLTGGGKTTTLCSILKAVNRPELNIMTLEDPVEYEIPRVVQAQINPKAGFTFAEGLRCILRQDPNVIMVGEVRDHETAEIALRAAMTGHLIFTTVHATTATGVINRLIGMGIEPYMITSPLIGTLAQRLIRRVCPECATPVALDEAAFNSLVKDLDPDYAQFLRAVVAKPGGKFLKGKGCPACKMTGFKGRVGIYELLVIDAEMQDFISRKPHDIELRRKAIGAGMETLLMDAVGKVWSGATSFDEAVRAVKAN